ncbi:MAG TPA: NAD(P)H-hydrate dehydratase [Paracoccaceae bacterium]|nr:NAD(P)H-hydrate dehydratase [Paracoccaceae bacterium]
MSVLLRASEMRAAEGRTIESGRASGAMLMERAARGVFEAICAAWPEPAAGQAKAAVLCGPGNNGGDGFVVARLLAELGWDVVAYFSGDPAKLPQDALSAYRQWVGPTRPLSEFRSSGGEIIVDALFGTGLARAVSGEFLAALKAAADRPSQSKLVAVDLLSGFSSETGQLPEGSEAYPAHLVADLTVTFQAPRLGHYTGALPARSGTLVVVPIGVDLPEGDDLVRLIEPPAPERLAKAQLGHKFGHGHALVIAGGPAKGGAARLAARGALRVGAGLVTVGACQEALAENAARLDAIMLCQIDGGEDLQAALADPRITALCLGPGLGLDAGASALLGAALGWIMPPDAPLIDGTDAQIAAHMRRYGRRVPVVLDADALTLLASEGGFETRLHEGCVLTPHEGEFARLFPDLTGPDKAERVRAAAKRAGCIVVLKGPDTVVAVPDGRVWIGGAFYDRAAPWLATAGSGDVLAGMIAGLMARGFVPEGAACMAVWLHQEAGRRLGAGLIAEDIPEALPAILRDLGA